MPKRDELKAQSNGASEEPTPVSETWLSYKQAAEYAGKSKQTITNAVKKHSAIFTADTQRSQTYHPDFPAVRELAKSAIDAWLEASAKDDTVGTRAARGAGRRMVIRVKDSDREAVAAALAPFGIELQIAYKSRAKNASAKPAPVSAPAEPAQSAPLAGAQATFETDLVEA